MPVCHTSSVGRRFASPLFFCHATSSILRSDPSAMSAISHSTLRFRPCAFSFAANLFHIAFFPSSSFFIADSSQQKKGRVLFESSRLVRTNAFHFRTFPPFNLAETMFAFSSKTFSPIKHKFYSSLQMVFFSEIIIPNECRHGHPS